MVKEVKSVETKEWTFSNVADKATLIVQGHFSSACVPLADLGEKVKRKTVLEYALDCPKLPQERHPQRRDSSRLQCGEQFSLLGLQHLTSVRMELGVA